MQIKKRLMLISVLTLIGSVLFVPFLIASESKTDIHQIIKTAFIFSILSTFIVTIIAWAGLRFSDKVNIKMPVLRRWESGLPNSWTDVRLLLTKSILIGIIIASVTLTGNQFMHAPVNPGRFLARISTTVWAAVVTETVSHLFILAGLMLLVKNKWVSILTSGLIFVLLFHLNSNFDPQMNIYLSTMNFITATVTGYLFIVEGFEYAVLTHMVIHFILLAVNR